MQVEDEEGIAFLDLKIKSENSTVAVDVSANPSTVSQMRYLLVATLEKVSIIYHVV